MTPMNPMNRLQTLPTPLRSADQPRIEHIAGVLVVAAACTLETLPIFCWLLLLAAYDTVNANNVAAPFWWLWLLLFGVFWLSVLLTRGAEDNPRRRRLNTMLLTVAVAALGPLTLLATYLLSPTTQLFLSNGSDTGGPVALALLVAYLWWRGLLLSRGRITRERMYLRFILALGMTIAALAGAVAIPHAARDLAASYLALLLALLLFVATMGLTLAQTRDAVYEMRVSYRGTQPLASISVFTRAWLAASLGLSLGLSLLALLFATLFSRQSVSTLAVAAGNIMDGLISAVEWLLTPVFTLIYLILNKPVEWLTQLFHNLPRQRPPIVPTTPPCQPTGAPTPAVGSPPAGNPCVPSGQTATTSLIPLEWLTVFRWAVVILIVVATLILLVRALHRFTERQQLRAFSEERTMLDAREILGGQFRRLFGGLRRGPVTTATAPTDELAEGSVRRVYRETLAAAAASGRARWAAETPREYQRRITRDDPMQPGIAPSAPVASALDELTHAYEQARYGQPDPDTSPPAEPATLDAARNVQRWLAGEPGM